MCLTPVQVTRYSPALRRWNTDLVPCGKCLECLKEKQNAYAFIGERETRASDAVHFVTLTYRNGDLPFQGTAVLLPRNCGRKWYPGDGIDSSASVVLSGLPIKSDYIDQIRTEYFAEKEYCGEPMQVPASWLQFPAEDVIVKRHTFGDGWTTHVIKSPVLQGLEDLESDELELCYFVTPSSHREDVQKWLKIARENYYRTHDTRLNFRYLQCSEYGSNTFRPHYHLMIVGCSTMDVVEMVAPWRLSYGRVDIQSVRPRGRDSQKQANEKVARYLAKYMAKGQFEMDFVRLGFVEKPRRVSSLRFGTQNLDDLRAYVLAFDVFGEYDPDKPPQKVLDSLDLLVTRRILIKTDDCGNPIYTKIPKVILNKIYSKFYGYYNFNGSRKDRRQRVEAGLLACPPPFLRLSHSRSRLSRALSAYQKKHAEDSFNERFKAYAGDLLGRLTSVDFRDCFASFVRLEAQMRFENAKVYRKKLSDFYATSIY